MLQNILVVDDEADIRGLVADILKDEGYETSLAKNSSEAFKKISEKVPSAVILDIWLKDSDLDGLGILETISRKYPDIPVIMISGHGNIETAVKSLRMGAYDYIEKPFKQDRIVHTIARAIESKQLQKENNELKMQTGSIDLLVGNSPVIAQLKQSIERVAPTGSRVFITGPSGAGKEIMARIIHEKSTKNSGPFIALNASGLSPETVDQELFGTEDNMDINSSPRMIGIFERANGGTLFIDEVTDIPRAAQGKFVRFLQDNSFERVGGNRRIIADVRVIAATSKNVKEEIASGKLREDLFYRLNVVPITAPALRERREDIPQICNNFLNHVAKVKGVPVRKLSDDAIAALQAYEWPGNVRQLRNMIEWLMIMNSGDKTVPINSEMLPHEVFSSTPAMMTPEINTEIMSMPLRKAREVFERQYLMSQINRFGGNISRTATFVGMERSALHRKLKSLEVSSEKEVVDA